jgi:very-short-patch-repair endonuclease
MWQHGVVTRRQLSALGLSTKAIRHRLASGRLHRVRRGVYAVGRPEITRHGRLLAAVLACGPGAVISHRSAAELWGIAGVHTASIELTVPCGSVRHGPGLTVHRCDLATGETCTCHGIPVTTPPCTLVDLATQVPAHRLEAAVSQADKLDLISASELPVLLAHFSRRPGLGILRAVLDRRTFRLTDSALERKFLALVRGAGLPLPETGRHLNGFKTDFFWPQLGLIVETDGLRYHRTAASQSRDRRRDQAHAAAGLTPLRFTHDQVQHEPDRVRATLEAVIRRLSESAGRSG